MTPTQSPTFEEQSLPHLNALYRTAFRLLLDESRAAATVENVYRKAQKATAPWPRTSPQPLSIRILLFQTLFQELMRRQRRNWLNWMLLTRAGQSTAEVLPDAHGPTLQDTDTASIDSCSDAAILAALSSLPLENREAVLLVEVEGFSYEESARILAIPVATVVSRVNLGRAILSRSLAGHSPTAIPAAAPAV